MNYQTIKKLIDLNHDFYEKISFDFHESRNHYWPGWNLLKNELAQQVKNDPQTLIIDLGCGTGRFALFLAEFLTETFPDLNWRYLGIDNSQKLLNIAKKETRGLKNNKNIKFEIFDLVSWLYENPKIKLAKNTAQIMTCFGFTHHLPDKSIRHNFLKILADQIPKNGLICVSFWQFMNEERFKNKVVSPTEADIDPNLLENNDFILDWQRGQKALRYCHFWSDEEIFLAVENSGLKIINDFKADSKSGQANHYLVLQKISK